ncbi:MAG: transposase [Actinomycetota bacterium]|nr:transposase [Actinomycetota bacterium]
MYLGEVKSDRKLAQSLNFNSRHCVLCGFNNFLKTPTHGVFSQFRKRLGEEIFHGILRKIIGQAIVLNIIKGTDVAIDSTHIIAYSNGFGVKTCNCKGRCKCERVPSDPDARVGAKSETHFFFGYKVHMLVDRASHLHIEVTATPGDSADSPYLIRLLKKAKDNHPKSRSKMSLLMLPTMLTKIILISLKIVE